MLWLWSPYGLGAAVFQYNPDKRMECKFVQVCVFCLSFIPLSVLWYQCTNCGTEVRFCLGQLVCIGRRYLYAVVSNTLTTAIYRNLLQSEWLLL